jgi:transcription elongation factor Elf1
MVKTWKSAPGGDFKCPHCGAVHETTVRQYPMRDADSANCQACGKEMDRWNSTSSPTYTLKKRTGYV